MLSAPEVVAAAAAGNASADESIFKFQIYAQYTYYVYGIMVYGR